MVRLAKDYSLPYGTDKIEDGALPAARSIKGFKYSEIGGGEEVVLLDSPVATADINDKLDSAIYNQIKGYEFDVKITSSWASDQLNFVHEGQSKITALVKDDDNEIETSRA